MKVRAAIFCLLFFVPIFVFAENKNFDNILELKAKADSILYKEVVPNLRVKAIQNNKELTRKNSDNAVVVETLSYMGFEGTSQSNQTIVSFSSKEVTPNIPIHMYFSMPNKIEKSAVSGENGIWQLDVPINNLPAGNHTAYLQVELNGVLSSAQAVANFNVSSVNRLSSKTWYLVIFIVFAIIILLFAVILQLRRNARDLGPGELI